MSATITIKIEVNDKREQYSNHITRTFPSDHAELTAADYYHRLKQELWDGVSDELFTDGDMTLNRVVQALYRTAWDYQGSPIDSNSHLDAIIQCEELGGRE